MLAKDVFRVLGVVGGDARHTICLLSYPRCDDILDEERHRAFRYCLVADTTVRNGGAQTSKAGQDLRVNVGAIKRDAVLFKTRLQFLEEVLARGEATDEEERLWDR